MGFAGTPNVSTQLYFAKGPDAVFLYDHVNGYLDWYAAGAGTPVLRLVSPGGDLTIKGELTFGASADKVEPRGRYWARPTPNGNYTLALADAGSLVVQLASAANVITIPPQSAVAWKSWTRIDVVQLGSGQITFAPGSGVTLNSAGGKRKMTGAYTAASLIQLNPDDWLLVGDIVA